MTASLDKKNGIFHAMNTLCPLNQALGVHSCQYKSKARDRTFISKYNLCEAIQRHTGATSFPPPTTAQVGNSAAVAALWRHLVPRELRRLATVLTLTKKRALGSRRRSSAVLHCRARATYLLNGLTPRRAPPLAARCVLLHERVPGFSLLFREATDVHCSSCFCRPDSRPLLAYKVF